MRRVLLKERDRLSAKLALQGVVGFDGDQCTDWLQDDHNPGETPPHPQGEEPPHSLGEDPPHPPPRNDLDGDEGKERRLSSKKARRLSAGTERRLSAIDFYGETDGAGQTKEMRGLPMGGLWSISLDAVAQEAVAVAAAVAAEAEQLLKLLEGGERKGGLTPGDMDDESIKLVLSTVEKLEKVERSIITPPPLSIP